MISVNLFAAMNLLGLPTQFDPNDGTSAGPAFVPTDLDPNNQTRSDARRTYYDPYANRTNFHVITGQHVTRILTSGIGGNSVVSNPTSGGNENGNGPASGNNDGFGFGPGGSTPPLSGSRFVRRQDPGNSNLRIIGVEVSDSRRFGLIQLIFISLLPMVQCHAILPMQQGRSLLLLDPYTRHSFSSFPASVHRTC